MNPRLTPADRDRAQWRVRLLTMSAAAGAAALTLGGAAAAAGTFAGRTVAADQPASSSSTSTDPTLGLQPPAQPPVTGGYAPQPIVSGGS